MSWEDYRKLFDELLPEVVRRARPAARLLAEQPAHARTASATDFNNPTCGDAHLWERLARPQALRVVPHLRAPLQQRVRLPVLPRAARPSTATPRREDRNITTLRHGAPPAQRHRQHRRSCSTCWTGSACRRTFEMTLWLSQILQGMAMKYAVRALAARDAARHGHALLAAQRLLAGGELGSHRLPRPLEGAALHGAPVLRAAAGQRRRGQGQGHGGGPRDQRPAGERRGDAALAGLHRGRQDRRHGQQDHPRCQARQPQGAHAGPGATCWPNTARRTCWSTWNWPPRGSRPRRTWSPSPGPSTWSWRRSRASPRRSPAARRGSPSWSPWRRSPLPSGRGWNCEDGCDYSDNFIHLLPGQKAKILVRPKKAMTVRDFREQLTVRSLVDTYV